MRIHSSWFLWVTDPRGFAGSSRSGSLTGWNEEGSWAGPHLKAPWGRLLFHATPVLVGRTRFLEGCWPEATFGPWPCDLCARQLMTRPLASLRPNRKVSQGKPEGFCPDVTSPHPCHVLFRAKCPRVPPHSQGVGPHRSLLAHRPQAVTLGGSLQISGSSSSIWTVGPEWPSHGVDDVQ